MKFISVRDFRTASSTIWKNLPAEREMVVTNNGKPVALLIPLSDATLEDTVSAVRRASAMDSVQKMQEISAARGNDGLTLDAINSIIADTREKNERRD